MFGGLAVWLKGGMEHGLGIGPFLCLFLSLNQNLNLSLILFLFLSLRQNLDLNLNQSRSLNPSRSMSLSPRVPIHSSGEILPTPIPKEGGLPAFCYHVGMSEHGVQLKINEG